MKNVPVWLNKREIRLGTKRFSVSHLNSGLKTYNLRCILPEDALEDIFLGFSADGCFLISFKADLKYYIIRFWLFPPSKITEKDLRLALFAQTRFTRMSYLSCLQENPGVRFIQSYLDPKTFVFLSCNSDGTGLVSAFGYMPDLDCSRCIENSTKLSHYDAFKDSLCTLHSQILLINLDLPSVRGDVSACDTSFDRNSQRHSTSKPLFHVYQQSTSTCVPPCLRIAGSNISHCNSNVNELDNSELDCLCFASTDSPIGRIQVGICPDTGLLRLAWASPDGQIKIICCSFEKLNSHSNVSQLPCMFPQGTCKTDETSSPVLAYSPHLLTHNYCSTCYSWPEENQSCPLLASRLPPLLMDRSECVFAQDPPRVVSVTDTLLWPESHVISMVLLSRSTPFQFSLQRSESLTYAPAHALDPRDENTLEWIDPNSSISSISSSDGEHYALISSPASMDFAISPEDLLAHRLSGQCHTSFDLTLWQDLGDTELGDMVKCQDCVIAHLEEVVFDIPISAVQSNGYGHSSAMYPILSVFIPPEEPDLLLVYQHLLDFPTENDQQNSSYNSTVRSKPQIKLIKMLDLTTGNHLVLPDSQILNKPVLGTTSHTHITLERLKKITSYCPLNNMNLFPHQKHLHELNNFQMACRLESLKLLIDPQGGYAVCW